MSGPLLLLDRSGVFGFINRFGAEQVCAADYPGTGEINRQKVVELTGDPAEGNAQDHRQSDIKLPRPLLFRKRIDQISRRAWRQNGNSGQ